ncbi:hypothetical protein A3B18_00025 [Candidatus Giovannonibacteria bacterium RIFCSPLOWO2_01_FULL_46_13]|uniref:Uncharacterized protein n=1 Tax=Candidatus Giovannonibacteria bacterium RIFCSPLOWO2_01_FULL_46_13 TaxID=1798352 RepID=A0A1F5X611_9BACT|nr:MAG: hypothetical protein A3B18_00025 [Candidatus Giovannonibacteria bacterium RIFCSPLOWO2_01_FULL_46_13]
MGIFGDKSHFKKKEEFRKFIDKTAKSLNNKEKKALFEKSKKHIGTESGISEKEFKNVLKEAEKDKESGIRKDKAYHFRTYGK